MRRSLGRLRETVVNEGDLPLFDEASRCLLAGANRAAYIIAWLSAAASIRSKLETLAPRDSHIGRKLAETEGAEARGGSVDRVLLQAAMDFGMISAEDFDNLENIRRMRNVYAHPRKSAPTSEEVLGALATVVRALLSKPALLRHGYASGVLRGVFEELHFLDDLPDRVVAFGRDVANRTDPQIHPWIFHTAISKLDAAWDDPALAPIASRGLAFLRGFLHSARDKIASEAWTVVEIVRNHPRCVSSVLGDSQVWPSLPEQAREIMIGYLTSAIGQPATWLRRPSTSSPGPLPSQAYDVLLTLERNGALSLRESERFAQALQACPIDRLAQFDVPLGQWAPQVVEALKSYNWYTQNPAVNALRQAGPAQIATLPPAMQEQLGRNILQAAEGMSNSAEFMMSEVADTVSGWPSDFLWGLIAECFINDAGAARIKARMLPSTFKCVCTLPPDRATSLLTRLNESLAAATPRDGPNGSVEFRSAAAAVRETLGQLIGVPNGIDPQVTDCLRQTIQHLDRLDHESTPPE
jgi:hypothetical protein